MQTEVLEQVRQLEDFLVMSDDGQVIALVRHSESGVALWAVDWNGRNPRELVPADTFDQRLESAQTESEPFGAGIGELEWIPGTHRLAYNWTIQGGSGDYWASPHLYLLDADSLSDTLLARNVVRDSVRQLNVVPSPGVLDTSTRPPWAFTTCWTIDRPSPRPPCTRVWGTSAWRNGSKM